MPVSFGENLLSKLVPTRASREIGAAAAKSLDTALADTGRAALKADSLTLSTAARQAPSSVLHFDANHPDVKAFAEELGWNRPGQKVGVMNDGTFLHYTADGGKTWKDAPLQYLADNRQGFLFRDLTPDSEVEYSLHLKIGSTHNQFYSIDQTAEKWLQNWDHNVQAHTEPNLR